jgi:hypothetical protein
MDMPCRDNECYGEQSMGKMPIARNELMLLYIQIVIDARIT